MADLPFKAEYAKSGRSSCKACKGSISQDSLRLAVMVQSPVFDGKIPNWFHYKCFWKRAKVNTVGDIHGYEGLRWEDQQKIKESVEGGGGGGSGGGGDSGGGSSGNYNDFTTEYAKSGKSTCRGCEDKIPKDEVRISKKEYDSVRAKMYGPVDLWYHLDCFVKDRDELEFGADMNVEKIKGYNQLKKEDRDLLVSKLGKGDKTAKKRKGGNDKGDSGGKKAKKEETEEEKKLKEQSQLIWSTRDNLTKHVSNSAMKILLELNGALGKVTNVLVMSQTGQNVCLLQKYQREEHLKFPKNTMIKKYKYVKRDRVYPAASASQSSMSASLDSVDSGSSGGSLDGMKFVIIGKTSKSKGDISKEIRSLGGFVVDKVSADVAACISTKDEVKKKSKNIKDAEKSDIHVVAEDFLEDVKKGGAALLIQKHSIAPWGSDPTHRIMTSSSVTKSIGKSAPSKKDEAYYTKSMPTKMKMKVKGGAAVDPDSGLEDTCHVIEEKGEIYNAVLGLVDVVKGTNSFYKLQALENDKTSTWYLFRAWGRVGTTIGGNKVERCGSKKSAIDSFKSLYGEKTGNAWEDRKDFKKYPNKFYPLEIDYGQDDEDDVKKIDMKGSKSKLPKAVQDLVCLIFDVENMKKAMMEFEKMPLGKLSKKQIESAYKVLTELTGLMEKGGTQTQFLDATNRFYTLVPHDFGLKKPPILNSSDIIKAKTEMLDNLLEIEVAYSLLKGGDDGEDPIDNHYKKLKTKIVPVDKKSKEFGRMVEYVKNTHASTHGSYELEVIDIFEIDREGEASRYAPFRDLHNKQLLWHGSRTTNYAGILSQGLRIAPPEAPVTGYMFGKGVYFADMVSKSANYCRTSKSDPIGLMMLCEVALGNMYERTGSDYITKLPKGMHSCKGVGMTCPDPSGAYKTKDDVIIPMGKDCEQNKI
ncbi:hypothetical protein KUTeg_013715 [Tegillarca granosa]|uniref:Poly [ADP-ribose] polymerase n=1 Tax=Tegillarca granosa TaxID=220873 RepID=A0ABQ9EUH1_TEGGR|nr:hypothetical protein KUTeg_013715 [Tegillarca granosa]